MELNKDQAKALVEVLYNEITTLIRDKNAAAIEEIENDETFNNVYNEFRNLIQEAKQLRVEAEKIEIAALKELRNKLAISDVYEWNKKHYISTIYARKLGKVKEVPTKQNIINRIMLATIDAKNLQTVKENVIKLFS